jgi:hypothetical protein
VPSASLSIFSTPVPVSMSASVSVCSLMRPPLPARVPGSIT